MNIQDALKFEEFYQSNCNEKMQVLTAYKLMKIHEAFKNDVEFYKNELNEHLKKISSKHTIKNKSEKETYPVPRMLENYTAIKEVYNILNNHVKLGISIHPAGEWLLDNFYAVEEITKSIEKELTISKYMNFVGLANGKYKGFARIYVVASEIVNYTDNKITRGVIEESLAAYQTKKSLSMDEIWNIGTFMQIAIIENIRQIAESIYISQMEKYIRADIVYIKLKNY